MEKLIVENSVFLPQVVQLIAEGHQATIVARGSSMRPFIEDSRDKLIFGKADSIAVGDVILAEVTDGHFVCHRIERLDGDTVTMRGDGNVTGTEVFPRARVRAKLLQVVRKGKTYTLATSNIWKCYSAVWPRLLPMRRYLLALYRLLWLHQLPDRWTKK
ncbi:MAG: S24/S26 family peptidase [Bacteroidaceae bacterium]|nr:S24/S26 family peptidase [Bacteroidaceae bacterium]